MKTNPYRNAYRCLGLEERPEAEVPMPRPLLLDEKVGRCRLLAEERAVGAPRKNPYCEDHSLREKLLARKYQKMEAANHLQRARSRKLENRSPSYLLTPFERRITSIVIK